jgi:NADH:ubiquinone oxidoreductase subunit 4 (subunit M)
MNLAHLHIATVHIPVIAIPLLTLLLVAGLRLSKPDLSKASLVGMVLVALLTVPVFLSGEGAEEIVEHLPMVSEEQVEWHEEVATVAFALVMISGLMSLGSLVATRYQLRKAEAASRLVVLAGAICTFSLFFAAYEGGKVRHSEIGKSFQGEYSEVEDDE